jgi:hypothetical protein
VKSDGAIRALLAPEIVRWDFTTVGGWVVGLNAQKRRRAAALHIVRR